MQTQEATIEHEGATTVHSFDVEVEMAGRELKAKPVFTSVTVYPEEGNFPVIARALLDAADHPRQVVSVSHPRSGFIVPEEIFQRFVAAQPDHEDAPVQEEPRKRRPGRPRKQTEPVVAPEKVEENA